MNKIVNAVLKPTKEEYKSAICKSCDDIKNRIDDILCDFDKHLKRISITINVELNEVSIINIEKEMAVEEDE